MELHTYIPKFVAKNKPIFKMSAIKVTKQHTLTGHRDCVYVITESKDSEYFFSGAGDGMIARWNINDPENGELVAKLPNSIYALHYHTYSDQLIAGHNYDGIHVIDWKNKKEVKSLHIGNAAIFDIQSVGKTLIVALGNGEIVFIDSDANQIIDRIHPTDQSARTIAIHPNKKEIAVGFSDNTIRIFHSESHKKLIKLKSHTNSVFTLAYSSDGSKLLSAGRDAHLKIWNAEDYTLEDDIVAHMYAINNIVFNPAKTHFATCSMDKSIKVWDATTNKLLKVIDKSRHAGHGTSVNKLIWSQKENLLISASDDRTISIWNIEL